MKRLNLNEKQEVKYVIPNWLRDEQIKLAIARVPGRIQPVDEPRAEPVAIAGFGPSLRDTWEQIRDFKYVVSCSGSHRFLIDRGIIPNWHVAVDPLPNNTVKLIGTPHPTVEYLISSTCHPDVFDHLEGFNVKLWHVFDATDDGRRLLPHGEWAVTGGCDVGLRAMTIAAFLGFRDLHVFGIDGCAKAGERHAGEHPTSGKIGYSEVEYPEGSGTIYHTTPGMLEAARQTLHELDQMPSVKATFYGEGLVQRLAKGYQPKTSDANKPFSNIVGFAKPELISVEYRNLNQKLHHDNLAYGVGGGKHADTVIKMAESIKTTSILDYGCGKGYLAKSLSYPIWEYDPAIPGKDESPRPADLVVCTDVLEHIEPDKLLFVLDDLKRCTRQVGFFVINTGPAQKTLADGRNTHLIQRDKVWWSKKLAKFFQIGKLAQVGPEIYVVVGPKVKGSPAPPVAAPEPECIQDVVVLEEAMA